MRVRGEGLWRIARPKASTFVAGAWRGATPPGQSSLARSGPEGVGGSIGRVVRASGQTAALLRSGRISVMSVPGICDTIAMPQRIAITMHTCWRMVTWSLIGLVLSVAAMVAICVRSDIKHAVSTEYTHLSLPNQEESTLDSVIDTECFGLVRRTWFAFKKSPFAQYNPPWAYHELEDFGARAPSRNPSSSWNQVATWGRLRLLDPKVSNEPAIDATEQAAGWPCLSFCCEIVRETVPSGTRSTRNVAHGGITLPPTEFKDTFATFRVIPLRPIWSGVVINALAFGTAAWLVCSVVGSVRRERRFSRGHCPACGYDLRSDYRTGCPECGWHRSTLRAGPEAGLESAKVRVERK